MPHITYLGPAFAGKQDALRAIAQELGGELRVDGASVCLRCESVVAEAVSGLVFEDDGRVAQLARTDAIVFVADCRASRQDQTLEMWESLPAYLERAGKEADTPVVVQWSHVEAEDARPVEEVEEMLGLQPFIASGELRMPNPYALRFPARFATALEAWDAARRAAANGPFAIPADAADFAKAMLDQQIAERIAGLVPNVADPQRLAKGVVRGDEKAREQLEDAMREDVMAALMERLENDPAFRQMILDEVNERLEATVMTPDLKCPACKEPCTSIDISGVRGGPFAVGDEMEVDLERLSPDLDWLMREPEVDGRGDLLWMTGAQCDRCEELVWCTLTIRGGALVSVWPTKFTRATYKNAHVVSCGGMQLEAARRLGVSPESLATRAAITEALERIE